MLLLDVFLCLKKSGTRGELILSERSLRSFNRRIRRRREMVIYDA